MDTPQPPLEPMLPPNLQPTPASGGPGRPRRLARLVALRVLRVPYHIGKALWPHRLGIIVSALLLALSGWLAGQLYWPAAGHTAAPTTANATAPEPAAAAAFLAGQEQFDAAAMWAALSPQAQQQLAAGGQTQLSWQARAEMEQRVGLRYDGHTFAGSAPLPDGGAMAFYLVAVQPAGQQEAQLIPLAFRIGPDGKILSIGNIS